MSDHIKLDAYQVNDGVRVRGNLSLLAHDDPDSGRHDRIQFEIFLRNDTRELKVEYNNLDPKIREHLKGPLQRLLVTAIKDLQLSMGG